MPSARSAVIELLRVIVDSSRRDPRASSYRDSSAFGMWASAYSSGTPKLTWNRRKSPVGAASGVSPARRALSQSMWTSFSYFGSRSTGSAGSAAQAANPGSYTRAPSTPKPTRRSARRDASAAPSPYTTIARSAVIPFPANNRAISGSSTVSSQATGNATAPGMWPPRSSRAEPPSVVRREWAHVDDGERRIIEAIPELRGIDGSGGGHWRFLVRVGCRRNEKTPAISAGVRGSGPACGLSGKTHA